MINNFQFNEKRHQYTLNGEKLPSVTRIIGQKDKSFFLIPWATKLSADYFTEIIKLLINGKLQLVEKDLEELHKKGKNESNRVRDESAKIGTLVHNAIELFIKQGEEPIGLPEQAQNAYNAFKKWLKEYDYKETFDIERPLYSRKHFYAGTPDWICRLGNKIWILDFKTSKALREGIELQLSAGAQMFEEDRDIKIDCLGGLRLDKESGDYEFKDFSKHRDKYFQCFLHRLEDFRIWQNIPKIAPD